VEDKKYIIIDEDENESIKWSDTLSEDINNIKYHQIIYIKDKSIAVLGESENEVWVDIDKKNLNNKTLIDFEKFLKSQNQNKDRFEKFKDYLTKNNIKFKEGDWQSFDNTSNDDVKQISTNSLDKPIDKLGTRNLKKEIEEAFALADWLKLRELKIRFINDRKKLTPEQLSNYKISDLEKRINKKMQELDKIASPKRTS
jgi:hypothetical protein|tara:strand:+ start:197 stop:793 length:597 start_codon:yes stop_codon:yes gene_type:complete